MAITVITAFDEFQSKTVNLDSTKTDDGRRSRDWLLDQIDGFPDASDNFPLLYPDQHIAFGSFARGTKIRPLDDIDLISCLHATGATYLASRHDDVRITVPSQSRLYALCHDGTDQLNSRKVINRFVKALTSVPQYGAAEINRRGEAATLKLTSYEWNFDIVPGFFTAPDTNQVTCYLIPNGGGHWKKTDPRVDRDRVARVNRRHEGNMLNVLRAVKYWQRRSTMPSMASYLLECIIVDSFDAQATLAKKWVDMELASVFRYIAGAVLGTVNDPKGIQPDLNTLSAVERLSISTRASSDATLCDSARALEGEGNFKESIKIWRDIFGPEFPEFG